MGEDHESDNLTATQVAVLLEVEERTVRKWLSRDEFKGRTVAEIRNGREVRTIPPDLLEAFRAMLAERDRQQRDRADQAARNAELKEARQQDAGRHVISSVPRSEGLGPNEGARAVVLTPAERNGHHGTVRDAVPSESMALVPLDQAPPDVTAPLLAERDAEIARLTEALEEARPQLRREQKRSDDQRGDLEEWKKVAVDMTRAFKDADTERKELRAVRELPPAPVSPEPEPKPGSKKNGGRSKFVSVVRLVHQATEA